MKKKKKEKDKKIATKLTFFFIKIDFYINI